MKFSYHKIFTQILLLLIVVGIFYNLFFLPDQLESAKMAINHKKNMLIKDKETINLRARKIAYDTLKINPRYKIDIWLRQLNVFRNRFEIVLNITDQDSNNPLDLEQFYTHIHMDSLYERLKKVMRAKYKDYSFEYFLIYRTKKSTYSTIKLPFTDD